MIPNQANHLVKFVDASDELVGLDREIVRATNFSVVVAYPHVWRDRIEEVGEVLSLLERRKKGTPNKRTLMVAMRASRMRDAAEASGILPPEVMLLNMRKLYAAGDLASAHVAARDCTPYMHARLNAVEARLTDDTKPRIGREEKARLALEAFDFAFGSARRLSKRSRPKLNSQMIMWSSSGRRPMLTTDHALTAPAYSERRSTMAKQLGLGRKGPRPKHPRWRDGAGGGRRLRSGAGWILGPQ